MLKLFVLSVVVSDATLCRVAIVAYPKPMVLRKHRPCKINLFPLSPLDINGKATVLKGD